MSGLVLPLAIALAAAALLTPAAAAAAAKLGIVDRPGGRKDHAAPVPLLGGGAVLLGALFGAVAAGVSPSVAWIGASTGIVFAVGLADDLRKDSIRPSLRLAVESAAALVAVSLGGLRAGVVPDGAVDAALAAGFLVLAANALNLSDNMNGLAAVLAAAAAGGLAAGASGADPARAAALAATAGAAAGFVPHNYPRARVFLGDAGSLSLGFLVAALALGAGEGTGLPPGRAALAAVVALGIPLADTALVVASRLRRGASVFEGDRRHVSHRLVALGLGRGIAVLVLGAAAVLLGALSVGARAGRILPVALAAAAVAALLAVASRAPEGLDGVGSGDGAAGSGRGGGRYRT